MSPQIGFHTPDGPEINLEQAMPEAFSAEPNGSTELTALAMAYDREDAAQRGEPDPWASGHDEYFEEWVTERLGCAQVAIEAYNRARIPTSITADAAAHPSPQGEAGPANDENPK